MLQGLLNAVFHRHVCRPFLKTKANHNMLKVSIYHVQLKQVTHIIGLMHKLLACVRQLLRVYLNAIAISTICSYNTSNTALKHAYIVAQETDHHASRHTIKDKVSEFQKAQ